MVKEEDLEVVVDGVTHENPVLDHICHLRLDILELLGPHQILGPHTRHSCTVISHLR